MMGWLRAAECGYTDVVDIQAMSEITAFSLKWIFEASLYVCIDMAYGLPPTTCMLYTGNLRGHRCDGVNCFMFPFVP